MKTMFLFSGLDEKQKQGLFELLPQLPIEVGMDGIRVNVKSGSENSLKKTKNGVDLTYCQPHDFFRLLSMLDRFVRLGIRTFSESNGFETLCYMADMSKNAVFNMRSAKEMIRFLSLMGYSSMMLYTEDTYEIPEYPYFGYMRGRFTEKDLQDLDDYCDLFSIELIPCIQTLGHLENVLQWDAFEKEKDSCSVLNVGAEETYTLIEKMLDVCSRCFRSKRIHLGMDGATGLGLGNYLSENPYRSKSELMIQHLSKVCAMCEEKGLFPMIWSDMFFRAQFKGRYHVKEGLISQSVIDALPENLTLVYWDYQTKANKMDVFRHMISSHERFHNRMAFAGGAIRWNGFAPNNSESIETAFTQLNLCREEGICDIIVTAWGDHGSEASQFSILPTLLYYAEQAYSGNPPDSWLESRSMECFGISFSDFLKVDIPNHVGKQYDDQRAVFPTKYLLYNDPFLGLMDQNMDAQTVAETYRANAKVLYPMAMHPHWGYLYATLYYLCDLLALKADLSVRIRKAYLEEDRTKLCEIADQDIPMIVRKLTVFTDTFRDQWYHENKTFGFEIQEDRLGGLRQRLISAAARLHKYVNLEIPCIEELEETQLPFAPKTDRNPYLTENNADFTVSPAKR